MSTTYAPKKIARAVKVKIDVGTRGQHANTCGDPDWKPNDILVEGNEVFSCVDGTVTPHDDEKKNRHPLQSDITVTKVKGGEEYVHYESNVPFRILSFRYAGRNQNIAKQYKTASRPLSTPFPNSVRTTGFADEHDTDVADPAAIGHIYKMTFQLYDEDGPIIDPCIEIVP